MTDHSRDLAAVLPPGEVLDGLPAEARAIGRGYFAASRAARENARGFRVRRLRCRLIGSSRWTIAAE